jgi:putative CocE/NonD family hydrolase
MRRAQGAAAAGDHWRPRRRRTKIGAVDFGPAAKEFDEHALTLDWYDYILKGKQNEFSSDKRVKLFVMGENKWRWEDDWPLKRAKETRFYLHSDGKANGSAGKGLSKQMS